MAKKRKILLVDDDRLLTKVLGKSLAEKGFQVVIANDGNGALRKFKNGNFSLVVLDIMMPNGNGYEVLEEMKAKKNKTPIVLLSNLSPKEISKAMESDIVMYFEKINTSVDEIVHFIEKLNL